MTAHPARYQQWLCWPCRHWAGGEGSVPAAPRSRPSTLPRFCLLPSSVRAPGVGALPQEMDWPDASWLALLFSSFRFYTLSTLLLSLLNPQAPGCPVPLALPLSIILPFLSLQTFSQLFFSRTLSKVTQLGWIRVGPSCAGSCGEGREAQDRGCRKGWHTPGLSWVRKTFKCSRKKEYSKSSKCSCLCQNRMKTRFQTALRGQCSSVEWNAPEVSSCMDCQFLTSFSPALLTFQTSTSSSCQQAEASDVSRKEAAHQQLTGFTQQRPFATCAFEQVAVPWAAGVMEQSQQQGSKLVHKSGSIWGLSCF